MMPKKSAIYRPIRAKLIFNTASSQLQESPQQLADIIMEMQGHRISPEVYMIRQDSPIESVVHSAIQAGIKLIVVAGGDGTIESVAGAMIGSSATLGIIPTGTRNNIAFNLGIPIEIASAVALLRDGLRLKIDVGQVRHSRASHWFVEAASLGLFSDLYPFADDFQHGDLSQIGNLLSTFVASTPSRLRLTLDGRQIPDTHALMVLIANMSYIGPHLQISSRVSCIDGRLDVFLFSDLNKLDLVMSYAGRAADHTLEDPNITHYRARQVVVSAKPPMPILADSSSVGQGNASLTVHPRALAVMTGRMVARTRVASRSKKRKVARRA